MAAQNLLLLPGMMCDSRQWAPQIQNINLPIYHADTRTVDNFVDMAAIALELAPASFAIAGLSMGGILAFEIWRQAPDRVTHLALLDTNPHAESPERQTLRLEQIKTAAAGGLREMAIESLKPLYLARTRRDDDELLDVILQMAMDLGPEVFARSLWLCATESTACPLSQLFLARRW